MEGHLTRGRSSHEGHREPAFETFSLATMIVQWGILFVVLYALNNLLANRVGSGPMSRGEKPPGGAPPGSSGESGSAA